MNRIDKEPDHKPAIEAVKRQEVEIVLDYQGTIFPQNGHTLFEIDIRTEEITEPEYEIRDYNINWFWKKGDPIVSHGEIIQKPNKRYVSALNKKNALRQFRIGRNGSKFNPNKEYLKLN